METANAPQDPFTKHPRAERARLAREKVLRDIYQDHTKVPLNAPALKTTRGTAYISDPTRPLASHKKLVGDMIAMGMKRKDIAAQLNLSPVSISSISRDPRVYQHIEAARKSITENAKELLTNSVMTAATNITSAVEAGDLKESHFVLAHAGIVEKRDQSSNSTNINMHFGDWLSSGVNTKDIHAEAITDSNTPQPIIDVDLLADTSEGGERL